MEQIILGVFVGLGLAAACGFRVFVPMLVVSIAGYAEVIPLSETFQWMGSLPAVIAFGVATVVEILAYYIPWVDNILDTIGLYAATIAGVVVMASALADLPPLLMWTVAIIGGGGGALTIKSLGTLIRAGSTATTGGMGNHVVSTLENIGSIILSILAIVVPIVAGVIALVVLFFATRKIVKWMKGKKKAKG